MKQNFLPGNFIALNKAVLVLAILTGCSATDLDRTGVPSVAAALDDQYADNSRTIAVYLVADRSLGFEPAYGDRIVVARAVAANTVVRAEAKTTVQGIDTVIVGSSCEVLDQRYSDIQECTEVDSVSRQYGEIENSAATDSEGFAILTVGSGAYRITMESWVTTEDQKCSWSGSEILSESASSLELPILVYCE